MRFFLFFFILFALVSCNSDKKTELLINNKTETLIDSLKIIYGTEKEQKEYSKLEIRPNEIFNVILEMNNIHGIDGSYFIEVYQKENRIEKAFGYYSNSSFKNHKYILSIKKDTILIKKD